MLNQCSSFDWSAYDNGYVGSIRLTPNPNIRGCSPKQICYSREKYAQELFDLYTGKKSKTVKKDISKGDCVRIIDIKGLGKHTIEVEIEGGLEVTVDLRREKKFVSSYGFNSVESFVEALSFEKSKRSFLDGNILTYIVESVPSVRISLWQGYVQSIKNEFMDQISNPTKAYTCVIKEANKGGFFVEIMGIDAFMPGSLAAPNKITDFRSYVGKEVIVMIEDYLKDLNSFIVSHKRYVDHVLPTMLDEIDVNREYRGVVTGTSKYGVFVEFEGLLTGLLHVSKMSDDMKLKFDAREIYPGDDISFYVAEISKDKRIILTNESPDDRYNRMKKFIFDVKDSAIAGKVVAVMGFGVIINCGEVSGLVPIKEFRRMKTHMNNLKIGDSLSVKFDEFKDDKIVFSLT